MTEPVTPPDDPLLACILAILTPLLVSCAAGSVGGLSDAAKAARQAIAAYQANGHDQLITIAQIVGFALTSLDNLRLSAAGDLSLSMKLKLRGNANALNLSTRRSAAALEVQRHQSPAQPGDTPARQPNPPAEPAAVPPIVEIPREMIWASAMTDVAAECSRNLNTLPPAQRRAEIIRIGALNETVRHLNRTAAPTRSSLLATTALSALAPDPKPGKLNNA